MTPPPFVLIGGVSGSGKSTLARELALRCGVTHVMASDVIRAMLRTAIARPSAPELYAESFDVPWRDSPSGPVNVDGFCSQARMVLTGLDAALAHAAREDWRVIVEGVHLYPGCSAMLTVPAPHHALEVLVVVRDAASHRARFVARANATSGGRGAERYLECFDAIRALQDNFVEQTQACGTAVIDSDDPGALDELCALWQPDGGPSKV